MNLNFFDDIKNAKDEIAFLSSFVNAIDELKDKINERLEELTIPKNEMLEKGELYYVYAYMPKNVYITKQGVIRLNFWKV